MSKDDEYCFRFPEEGSFAQEVETWSDDPTWPQYLRDMGIPGPKVGPNGEKVYFPVGRPCLVCGMDTMNPQHDYKTHKPDPNFFGEQMKKLGL